MRTFFIMAMFILLCLSSCITILQSLSQPDNLSSDDRVTGKWKDAKGIVYRIERIRLTDYRLSEKDIIEHKYSLLDSMMSEKGYLVEFEKNNVMYWWTASLVKIRDQYYMEISPVVFIDKKDRHPYSLESSYTTFSLARINFAVGNGLQIDFLNGDKIKDIVLSGNARISHEYDPMFGTFVITASSKELEKFLYKYGDNESLYKGGHSINLHRQK